MSAPRIRAAAAALLLALVTLPALAVTPDELLPDPALEARARVLSAELRCMVCQNQSIDDSDASLAKDIRVLIRERIAKGETNAQIRDFLVSRYGDFILLNPPFRAGTWLLWLGAPLALALGALALARGGGRLASTAPLSPDEERRLGEL